MIIHNSKFIRPRNSTSRSRRRALSSTHQTTAAAVHKSSAAQHASAKELPPERSEKGRAARARGARFARGRCSCRTRSSKWWARRPAALSAAAAPDPRTDLRARTRGHYTRIGKTASVMEVASVSSTLRTRKSGIARNRWLLRNRVHTSDASARIL